LDHEQISKLKSGESAVGRVAHAAGNRITIGGAQDADRGGVSALDFEVNGVVSLDG